MNANETYETSPPAEEYDSATEAALEHENGDPGSDTVSHRDESPLTRQRMLHLIAKRYYYPIGSLRESLFGFSSSPEDSHILRFDIKFNRLPNSSVDLFLRWLQSCDNLRVLSIHCYPEFGDQEAIFLARCFAKHKSLRVLHLGTDISGQGIKEILTLRQLTTLNISYNTLDEVGAKALAHFIRANEVLQDLDISGCFELADTVNTTVLNTLCEENPKSDLRRLEMSNNRIAGEDAVNIMKAMVKYPHIRWVDLSSNDIGDEHMKLMAKHIASSDTLEVLRLCDNAIETEGAVALGTEIRNKGALRQLFLDRNRISTDGLTSLLESRGLRVLSMFNNYTCGSMSNANLAAALSRTNVWELSFSVWFVRAEDEGIYGILDLIKRHRFAEISLCDAVVQRRAESFLIEVLNTRDSMAQLRVVGGNAMYGSDHYDEQLVYHNSRVAKIKSSIKKCFMATAALTAECPSQENLCKYCLTFEPGELSLERLPQAVVPNILQLLGPSSSHEYKYGIYTHFLYAVLRKKAMGTSWIPWSNIRRKLLSKRKFESVMDNDSKLPGKQKR